MGLVGSIQFLVEELRSHKLCRVARKKKKENNNNNKKTLLKMEALWGVFSLKLFM